MQILQNTKTLNSACATCSQGPQHPRCPRETGSSPHTFPCFSPWACSLLQLENAAKKRERTTSDPRSTEQKQEKKRLKTSKKLKNPDPPQSDFTPYDYSQSDFKAFAGKDTVSHKETPRVGVGVGVEGSQSEGINNLTQRVNPDQYKVQTSFGTDLLLSQDLALRNHCGSAECSPLSSHLKPMRGHSVTP
jgi:hypothetical protein